MQAEAKTVALTRTLGIIAGVTMTLVLSVTILPVSAHYQHEEALNKALRSLLSLQALCWVPLTHTHESHGPSFLSPTPRTRPLPGRYHTCHEHSAHTSAHIDYCPEQDIMCADSCTVPLLSPRSPRISPHTSPSRSCSFRFLTKPLGMKAACMAPLSDPTSVQACPQGLSVVGVSVPLTGGNLTPRSRLTNAR